MHSNDVKAERHKMIDPRMGQLTQQNAMLPGGPSTNTPYTALQSEGTPINTKSVYGDHVQNDQIYPQGLGTTAVNPTNVKPSGLLQFNPLGQRLNSQPFNMQQQPDASGNSPLTDQMESNRLAQYAMQKGLPTSAMGLTGMPAIPGGMPGDMPGTSGPQLMPGMPGEAGMIPCSTPHKLNQKKKGGKK